ncbi:expressed unknown protein [Seminavis robusta]|uniref:Uncharacterized protein n=1 Tax=Seminavis robusta TaxID=568900 RepID=A0A9N8HXT4_9STRA|nr:expressed unknown protein [Seminavis robusta]|eukprot:Sro2612_g332591.1  (213) ;mRNA; f:4779-5475
MLVSPSNLHACLRPLPTTPSSFIAIDITVTSPPESSCARPAHQPKTLSQAHLKLIRTLQSAGVILLPFTVDPFLGLGPFAQALLYGSCHQPFPLPAPPWFDKLPPHSQLSYTNLLSAPTAILPTTDKHFEITTNYMYSIDTQPYTPSRWAHQSLALNISTHLAQHFQRAITHQARSLYFSGSSPSSVLAGPYTYVTSRTPGFFPHFLQADVT